MNLKYLSDSFVLVSITILLSANTSSAQNDKPYNIGAAIGLNSFHSKDEHVNDLTYNGLNFLSSVNFTYRGKENIHTLEAYYSGGSLESEYGHENVNNFIASLSYMYYHFLGSSSLFDKPIKFYVGTGLSALGWNSDYSITTRYVASTFETYYVRYSLDAAFGCEYEFTESGAAYMNITLPVWQYIGRPVYIFDDTIDGIEKPFHQKPSFLWNDFSVFTELGYRTSLSGYFLLDLKYKFEYASTDITLPVNMFSNSFTTGIIWNF